MVTKFKVGDRVRIVREGVVESLGIDPGTFDVVRLPCGMTGCIFPGDTVEVLETPIKVGDRLKGVHTGSTLTVLALGKTLAFIEVDNPSNPEQTIHISALERRQNYKRI
jgi:hypothetical protein